MRVEVLVLSVIWDVLGACALIANHRGVARMHTHWWTDKVSAAYQKSTLFGVRNTSDRVTISIYTVK